MVFRSIVMEILKWGAAIGAGCIAAAAAYEFLVALSVYRALRQVRIEDRMRWTTQNEQRFLILWRYQIACIAVVVLATIACIQTITH
jgi:hypothetical protein